MKTVFLFLVMTTSLFAQSNEKVSEIAKNKLIQKKITQEIRRISNIDATTLDFESFLSDFQETCLSRAESKSAQVRDAFLIDCAEKSDVYKDIGDVQTILDLQVSELEELQSSLLITALWLPHVAEQIGFVPSLFLLPFTLLADVFFFPITTLGIIFGFGY